MLLFSMEFVATIVSFASSNQVVCLLQSRCIPLTKYIHAICHFVYLLCCCCCCWQLRMLVVGGRGGRRRRRWQQKQTFEEARESWPLCFFHACCVVLHKKQDCSASPKHTSQGNYCSSQGFFNRQPLTRQQDRCRLWDLVIYRGNNVKDWTIAPLQDVLHAVFHAWNNSAFTNYIVLILISLPQTKSKNKPAACMYQGPCADCWIDSRHPPPTFSDNPSQCCSRAEEILEKRCFLHNETDKVQQQLLLVA